MLRKISINPTDHESVPDGRGRLAAELQAGADKGAGKGADKGVNQGVDPLKSLSEAASEALAIVGAATSDHGIDLYSQAR